MSASGSGTENGRSGPVSGILLVVLVVAAFFRLYALSLMEFRLDAAFWSADAMRILQGGYWPLVGQQIGSVPVALANGPLLSYLSAAIFALCGPDPRAVAGVIAGCNVAAVWLTFRLGRRLHGDAAGLVAAALAAAAPWLVLYGRMLWPQSLFPMLVPLLLIALLRASETRGWLWPALLGIGLGLGVQLHLSLLTFVGTSIVCLAAARGLGALVPLMAGCVLGYAPVLAHDALHGWPTVRALARLPSLHAGSDPWTYHAAKTMWNFTNVLSGQGLWVSKLSHTPYLPQWMDWLQGALLSALFCVSVASIFGARADRSRPRERADNILLLFVILHTGYLLASRSQVNRHYFLVLYPVPFLLIGAGIESLRRFSPPIARLAVVAVLIAWVLNAATVAYAYRFLARSGGEGEYGTVLSDKEAAVDAVVKDSKASYVVDLAGTQEALPYDFLLSVRSPAQPVSREPETVRVLSASSGSEQTSYRIVEPAYHDAPALASECVLFHRRGVIVVRPCPDGSQSR